MSKLFMARTALPRLVMISLALIGLLSIAQSQTRPRDSLRGLTGIHLYIHPVDKEVEAGGLSTTQIQDAVQKQLREAGIPLQPDPQPANGYAALVIVVSTIKRSEGAYLFDVDISLLQEVQLTRRKDSETFPSQTWGAKALGITGAKQMSIILEPIKERVGDFISDYLSVNPKPQP